MRVLHRRIHRRPRACRIRSHLARPCSYATKAVASAARRVPAAVCAVRARVRACSHGRAGPWRLACVRGRVVCGIGAGVPRLVGGSGHICMMRRRARRPWRAAHGIPWLHVRCVVWLLCLLLPLIVGVVLLRVAVCRRCYPAAHPSGLRGQIWAGSSKVNIPAETRRFCACACGTDDKVSIVL